MLGCMIKIYIPFVQQKVIHGQRNVQNVSDIHSDFKVYGGS